MKKRGRPPGPVVDLALLLGDVAKARVDGSGIVWRERGWSWVADQIGVSKFTISRLKRGLQPDLRSFVLICRWLDRSPVRYLPLLRGRPTLLGTQPPKPPTREDQRDATADG